MTKLELSKPKHFGANQMGSANVWHIMHSIDFATGKTFKAKCGQVFPLPHQKFRRKVEVDVITAEAIIAAADSFGRVCSSCVKALALQVELRRAEGRRSRGPTYY